MKSSKKARFVKPAATACGGGLLGKVPLPEAIVAEQLALVPPLLPTQLQFAKSLPTVTAEAVPLEHRLVVGGLLKVWPFDKPHCPLIAVCRSGAEHCALVPPFDPVQLHDHGPVPLMADAVPLLQRLVVGAVLTATLLALPQLPLVEACVTVRLPATY